MAKTLNDDFVLLNKKELKRAIQLFKDDPCFDEIKQAFCGGLDTRTRHLILSVDNENGLIDYETTTSDKEIELILKSEI